MAFGLISAADPSDHDASQPPRYTRRLSDKILVAFHQSCDQGDIAVAKQLLDALEFMAMRPGRAPDGRDRRVKESLVAAHERLWHIRHPELTQLWRGREHFEVEVLGADGVRHTMLGFTTETEAEAWIVSDRLLERAVERDVS